MVATTPVPQAAAPALPADLESVLTQHLIRVGMAAGREVTAPFLRSVMTAIALNVNENPRLVTEALAQVLPWTEAAELTGKLTQLQAQTQFQTPVTLIQPMGQPTSSGSVQSVVSSPAPPAAAQHPVMSAPVPSSFGQLSQGASQAPVGVTPDPDLLESNRQLFMQFGVNDPAIALDWAKQITTGYTPSRPLAVEELEMIDRLLGAADVESLIEPIGTGSGLDLPRTPTLWAAVLGSRSPVTLVALALLLGASHFLTFQVGWRGGSKQETQRSLADQQRIIKWANCTVAGSGNCLAP